MYILKRALLLLALLIVLAAIAFGVYTLGRLVVSAMLGSDIVNGGAFYFAVAVLSLMIYLFLIVFVIHSWDKLKDTLRNRQLKTSKR